MDSLSGRDDAVIETNDDAAACKASCVALGYYADPFIRYFNISSRSRVQQCRKPPLINRGYWSRVSAIRRIVTAFLSATASCKKQVVVLGAGYDTLYFHLLSQGIVPDAYWEMDFSEVMQEKEMKIARNHELKQLLQKSGVQLRSNRRGRQGAGNEDLPLTTLSVFTAGKMLLSLSPAEPEKSSFSPGEPKAYTLVAADLRNTNFLTVGWGWTGRCRRYSCRNASWRTYALRTATASSSGRRSSSRRRCS